LSFPHGDQWRCAVCKTVFRFEPRAAVVTVVQPRDMVMTQLGDGNVHVQPKDGYGSGFYISKEGQLSVLAEEGPLAGFLITYAVRPDGSLVRVEALEVSVGDEDDVPGPVAGAA
jgi:hypothetical protein